MADNRKNRPTPKSTTPKGDLENAVIGVAKGKESALSIDRVVEALNRRSAGSDNRTELEEIAGKFGLESADETTTEQIIEFLTSKIKDFRSLREELSATESGQEPPNIAEPIMTELVDGEFRELDPEASTEAYQDLTSRIAASEAQDTSGSDAQSGEARDAETTRLLNREVSLHVELPNQLGSLDFLFSEVRVPTNEEIIFITREWVDQEPSLDAFLESEESIEQSTLAGGGTLAARPNQNSSSGLQRILDLRDGTYRNFSEFSFHVGTILESLLEGVSGGSPNQIWIPISLYGEQRPTPVASAFVQALARTWIANGTMGDARVHFALLDWLTDEEHKLLRDEMSDLQTKLNESPITSPPPPDPKTDETSTRPDITSEDPPEFHPDRPVASSEEDDLGRAAVAEVIVRNVTHVWGDQRDQSRPFAVHLSGRWGSGKSSILNFLREKLEAETTHSPKHTGTIYPITPKGWVVVDYNAWQMQGAGPVWWTLRNAVVEAGKTALGGQGVGFAFRDRLWKFGQVMRPWLVLLFVLLVLLSFWLIAGGDLTSETQEIKAVTTEDRPDGTTVTTTRTTTDPLKNPDSIMGTTTPWAFLAGIASLLGALGALLTFLGGFLRTSTQTAEAIQTLQSDPTETLKKRFAQIIKEIERPVAIFIDDLDRCEATFVVEVLQALQTSYADVPVLYVVAADRDWIVSAYNQTYQGFDPEISKPGSPLGYLFLKKIFQLSVNVPDLSRPDVDTLTRVLLDRRKDDVSDEERTTQFETLAAKIAEAEGDLTALGTLAPEIKRSSVAKDLAPDLLGAVISSKGQKAIRHALLDYIQYFDGNPRSVKRLINALTFRQGYILLAGEQIKFDTVARWTILDLRFPYTAAQLSRAPDKILATNRKMGTPSDPGPDAEYFHDQEIDDILTGLDEADIEGVSQFG